MYSAHFLDMVCCVAARSDHRAFTLLEVVVSMAVMGLVAGGIIEGYIQSARSTDWQAHSLAAQSLALERIEQGRAAKWDTRSSPPVDELVASNFPPQSEQLDLPVAGTNIDFATIYTTLQNVSTNPPLRLIRADCVWRFTNGRLFTNSVVTYRAPDE